MKKRIIALAAVMTLAVSMTGCGKKDDNTSNIVDKQTVATTETGTTSAPKTEEQIKDELANFAKDADENADLSNVEGQALKGETVKADLGGYEVAICDAVLADGETSKVLVVEFEFKNNTSQPTKFSSVIEANAFQDDTSLAPAATFSAEGYEILTVAQDVKYNEKIKVQQAYVVRDPSQPVTVEVMKHGNVGGSEVISKTFTF